MKKIIIISLIAILITASSYAQSKKKYTDTAITIDPSNIQNMKSLNQMFQDGWKSKLAASQGISVAGGGLHEKVTGLILLILTKPLKSNEE